MEGGAGIIAGMTSIDYTTDITDLHRRASQGDPEAMEAIAARYAAVPTRVGGTLPDGARLWSIKRRQYWERHATATWRQHAEAGAAAAWRHMADLLHRSPLFHPQRELEWTRRAAEGGDVDACIDLCDAYDAGNHLPCDKEQADLWHRRALDALQKRAEAGDVSACGALALECEDGAQAAHWRQRHAELLRERAEGGDVYSCIAISSLCLSTGFGDAAPDEAQAVEWMGRATALAQQQAEGGDAAACLHMVELCETVELEDAPSMPEALHWMRRAAELGHSEGMFMLGRALLQGEGAPQDLEQAYHWLQRAAEKGHPDALALCFVGAYSGMDAEKPLARQALEALGNAGHAEGCFLLSLLHHNPGVSVLPDASGREQSIQWLEKAAAAGDMPEALLELGLLFSHRDAPPEDKPRAHPPLQRAAEAGDADAACLLAFLLWDGIGAPRSNIRAAEWMEQSAAAGNSEAAATLFEWLAEFKDSIAIGVTYELIGALDHAVECGNATACVEMARQAFANSGDTRKSAQLWGNVLARDIHLDTPAIESEALDALTTLAQKGEEAALEALRDAGSQGLATPAITLRLARLYLKGFAGASADKDEAVRWLATTCGNADGEEPKRGEALRLLTSMAEKGYPAAIRALYEMEASGVDTCGRRGKVPALLKVAKKNHPDATFLAGELLRLGNASGQWQDVRKAADWYAKAAKRGHEGAKEALQHLPALISLFERASEGDTEATWRLAQMRETGDGQRQNLHLACEGYVMAALLGHTPSLERLQQLSGEGESAARHALQVMEVLKEERGGSTERLIGIKPSPA